MTKWECTKCLFDNESTISFCLLCDQHAPLPFLRKHAKEVVHSIQKLQSKDNVPATEAEKMANETKLADALMTQKKLEGIIMEAEDEAEAQRLAEAEAESKWQQNNGRPWPSLNETMEEMIDSVTAELEGVTPTFEYSWNKDKKKK